MLQRQKEAGVPFHTHEMVPLLLLIFRLKTQSRYINKDSQTASVSVSVKLQSRSFSASSAKHERQQEASSSRSRAVFRHRMIGPTV